jgi:hypothetical protein
LLLAAGIPVGHVIWAPTQGSAPALVELLGGHVDVVCCSVPEAASQLESGQVRVLAVLAPERLTDFPEYPTAREQGVAYDAVGWRGIMLPRGTPPEIVQVLSANLAEIARSDAFRQFMKKNGFAVVVRDSAGFVDFLRTEEARWRDVIRNAGYETLGQNHDPGPAAMPTLLGALLALCLAAEALLSAQRRRLPPPPGVPADDAASVSPPEMSRAPVPAPPGLTNPARAPVRDPPILAPADPAGESGRLSSDARFLLAALVLYLAVMPWMGFSASTFIFALVVMWRLGTRWWWAATAAGVIVVSIHLLFVTLFKVQLP